MQLKRVGFLLTIFKYKTTRFIKGALVEKNKIKTLEIFANNYLHIVSNVDLMGIISISLCFSLCLSLSPRRMQNEDS